MITGDVYFKQTLQEPGCMGSREVETRNANFTNHVMNLLYLYTLNALRAAI